jgi:hypothetical protein
VRDGSGARGRADPRRGARPARTAAGRFYADCITQASAARTYDREGTTLRFRCTGEPARDFYEGLGSWAARTGSEREGEGRTWRFTSPMQRDPSGLDFCTRDAAGEHRCTVVLRVGEFLAFAP